MRVPMSVCDAFERDPRIHIRRLFTEKDVVFPMRLVVIDHIAARDISGLYAPVALDVRTLR